MNLLRYSKKRILKMLAFVTIGTVSIYLYHFYTLQIRESLPITVKLTKRTQTTKNSSFNSQRILSVKSNDVMENRLKIVQEGCQNDIVIHKAKFFRFPIAMNSDDPFYRYKRSKTCMCKAPKVASTMLSKLLIASEFPRNISFIQNMPGYYAHASVINDRFQRSSCEFQNDLKFLVVRNPYSRIFSAYIDKIFLGKFKSFASEIQFMLGGKKKSRNYFQRARNVSSQFICTHHDVTFDSFLRWILFHYKVDWHFAPITRFCNPCEHHFDVIIKQENSRDEMRYVTEQLPVSMDTSLFTDASNDNKIKDLIMILHDLWNNSETSEECGGIKLNYTFLNERFWDTLKIQGYIPRKFTRNALIFQPTLSGKETFARFLEMKVEYLSDKDRSAQRHEYLVEAYKNIDETLLKQFRTRFYSDFLLFDYSFDPPS